jgi:hypothetical protein
MAGMFKFWPFLYHILWVLIIGTLFAYSRANKQKEGA